MQTERFILLLSFVSSYFWLFIVKAKSSLELWYDGELGCIWDEVVQILTATKPREEQQTYSTELHNLLKF
jgi:hypothetical protein